MSLSIKSFDNIRTNLQSGSDKKETETAPKPAQTNSTPKESRLSNTTKYMIGATALAGTVAFGIIGHKNNWWRKVSQQSREINSELSENSGEAISELKQLTLDKFKEIGEFIKGKAQLTNGELYSGTITKQNLDGNTLTLVYENGFLKKSFNNKNYKKYTYNDDGKLIKCNTNKYSGDKYSTFSYDKDSGKITKIHLADDLRKMSIYYDKNGKVKYINGYKFKPSWANDIVDTAIVEFNTITGKPTRAYNWQTKRIYEFDKNGNVTQSIETASGISPKIVIETGKGIGPKELLLLEQYTPNTLLQWKKTIVNSVKMNINNIIWIEDSKMGKDFKFMKRHNGTWTLSNSDEKYQILSNKDGVYVTRDSAPKDILAKYNPETKVLDISSQFKDYVNEKEIKEVFDEFMSVAHAAKQTIRNTYKHIKEKNEFINELRNAGILN